ncbi:hypothetical protein NIES2119_28840 [[Phormidium ambiguum] IAM M-71]|uniref:Cytotoxic translational repressor of toxin-antitoxin stability system n=1 Tax=[Phormidium ambiguum] IAM M-71 TaxID=454136 RepID=A0A1U7I528_9CYAN|nr:hypothetical protein [Phormidium ambiguum]OKH31347.1 hypothetical protein NIES2119_28840 [Phormidium ambiguum IAM M-71]
MDYQAIKFEVLVTPKVKKELAALPLKVQKQYHKAFQVFAKEGPIYRSLRTHCYKQKKGEIWGSSASMALRFYWEYQAEKTILVIAIDSH